jgi:hypothetical protein
MVLVSLVKKATRAVKKIVKSPVGKAALLLLVFGYEIYLVVNFLKEI